MSEWTFRRDTSFRKQFFVPESFSHPAKMDAQLLIKIVETYTEVGETILDPMAGSGTTMLACMLDRNCILVELEEKFCKMMRDNWNEVKMRPQLGYSMGQCEIIQGDARNLEGVLNVQNAMATIQTVDVNGKQGLANPLLSVDKIISSPPYAEGLATERHGIDLRKTKRDGDIRHQSLGHLTYGIGFGKNPNNIGGLPYGNIDKCIFSPPFAGNKGGLKSAEGFCYGDDNVGQRMMGGIKGGTGENPNNIDALPYGEIDKCIFSPPYEGLASRDRSQEGYEQGKWGDDSPYFNSLGANAYSKGYGDNKENIGNLKSQSYLQAMLQVYQQCHKVLKPQGLLILVTKNFIRNKKVIRLDEDTIKLCEQAGFSFLERHYRTLPSQSFWRVIYHQKHPEVEQINHEDVLVFQK